MTFSERFDPSLVRAALANAEETRETGVRAALASGVSSLDAAAALLSPAAGAMIEELAAHAHRATVERFGKTMQMYAPLYLSNECVCTCTYCGFSQGLDIRRKTLRLDEVAREDPMDVDVCGEPPQAATAVARTPAATHWIPRRIGQ